jgi:hypothetical protein
LFTTGMAFFLVTPLLHIKMGPKGLVTLSKLV